VAAAALAVCVATAGLAGPAAAEEVTIQGTTSSGRVYERSQWGLLNFTLYNPTDDPVRGELLIRWPRGRGTESGVDIDVPPRSRLAGEVPIYSDDLARPNRGQGPELTLDLMPRGGGAGLIATGKGIVPVDRSRSHVGLLGSDRETRHQAVVAALLRLDDAEARERSFGGLTTIDSRLALTAYEMLVWCGQAEDLTAAEAGAVRQWLADGGQLWVMLDAVDPEAVQRVLGEAWQVAVLDRGVVSADAVHDDAGPPPDSTLEADVEAVRVLAPTMRTHAVADGFPAVLTADVGAGRLLVTTVGPGGWIDDRGAARDALSLLTPFVDLERRPGRRSPLAIATGGEPEPGVAELSAEMAVGMVGHRVLSRGWALTILGGLVVVLLAAAAVLAARRMLGWFVAVAVGGSLLASCGLIAVGALHRTATPHTTARVQVARAGGVGGLASVDAVEAQYSPHGNDDGTVVALGDGVPRGQTLERLPPTARVVWDGDGHAELRGMPPRPGATRVVHSRAVRPIAVTPRVTLTLDESGLTGRVTDADRGVYEGPAVVGPWRITPASVTADGELRLTAGATDGAGAGWQRSREAVARERLLEAVLRERPPDRGGLFAFWVAEEQRSGDGGDEQVRRGQTLVLVPVAWSRPETGATVRVPDAVLDRQNATRRNVYLAGNGIIPTTNRWVGAMTGPKTVLASFQPPAALLPLRPVSATLTLDIDTGPLTFEVVSVVGEQFVVVGELSRTRGRRSFPLTAEHLPRRWTDGGLVFGVRPKLGGGRLRGDQINAAWSLRDMAVDVTAEVVDPAP